MWSGSYTTDAADTEPSSFREREGQCESYECESSRGRFIYISGERDGFFEHECDVVGEWDEWRNVDDGND